MSPKPEDLAEFFRTRKIRLGSSLMGSYQKRVGLAV